jgi:hypothetical protein
VQFSVSEDRRLDRTAITAQIARILRSPSFADKSQLRKLLEILSANMDSQSTLKPDRVIRELWPGEASAKGSADLAAEVYRLRKALECYYCGEGKNDPITVSLPRRSTHALGSTNRMLWITAEPRPVAEDEAVSLGPSTFRPATSVAIPTDHSLALANRRRILMIFAAIAFIGVAGYFVIRTLAADDRPQAGRVEGNTLTIVNGKGEELWTKTFPDGFWSDYYSQGSARIWFGDLDGKGRTDVLLLYHPGLDAGAHSTTLICYSDRGKEKWRWTPGRDLPELEGLPATFRTVGFGVLKARSGQASRIVVSSIHVPLYPHQIAILDSNGKMTSEYWHSGHLFHLTLADLDGDGRDEIIASGISNGYRQATLIVLDPDRVFGASTEVARPEIQIHGMGAAAERLRLLFPRSDLNKALYTYNEGQDVTVGSVGIRFNVRECAQREACKILYVFDKSFQLITVEIADEFRGAHKEFYMKSKDDHPFSLEEEAEFRKVRCLVGCTTEFLPIRNR